MQIADCYQRGWQDVRAAFVRHHVVLTLGHHDIASRYKRSRVGAFWLTIGMAVSIGSIGLMFGQLFKVPNKQFLPYFTAGSILWGFISSVLSEGCTGFIAAAGVILQVRMPLFVHVLRLLYRDVIVFAHNAVILPLVFLVFAHPVGWRCLLAIPGFLILLANLAWMVLILSVICARYRDVTQIVQNAVHVLYFMTPIMWSAELLPARAAGMVLGYNPFYHLISIVRAPLLGDLPRTSNWVCSIGLLVVGWVVALGVFGRFRNRITYWL